MLLSKKRILFVISLITIVLLLGVSKDSYFYDLYDRTDSACFFMCGKAWMNGFTPYVDFADSKGPILWLIYGIGYLLSPSNFLGIFWLSCLSYIVTFYFCYKIARLYLDGESSFIVMALMGLCYFNPYFYEETRSEDFCNAFTSMSLYYILAYAKGECKDVKKISFIWGISFACCLLMKFTIAAMSLIFPTILFFLLVREKEWKKMRQLFLYYLGALLLIILPITCYFLYKGCFTAFIREYFLNTFLTVKTSSSLSSPLVSYIFEWLWTLRLRTERFGTERLFYILYIVVCFLFSYKDRKNTYFIPFISGMFFLAIAVYHSKWNYYLCACSTWAIFMWIAILQWGRKYRKSLITTTIGVIFSVVLTIGWNINFKKDTFFTNSDRRSSYYSCEYVMSQIKNPTIVYLGLDIGFGTTCQSLPGGKYWITQNGMTDEMLKQQLADIKKLKPDFIALWKPDYEGYIQSLGYVEYGSFNHMMKRVYRLYGKPGLKLLPFDYQVTDMDILLKRKI